MMLEIWLPGLSILGLLEQVVMRETSGKEIDGILQANASAPFGGLAGEKFVKVLEVTWNSPSGTGFQNSFRVSDLVFFVPQTKPRALPPNKCRLSADHESPEFNANPHETPIANRNNRI